MNTDKYHNKLFTFNARCEFISWRKCLLLWHPHSFFLLLSFIHLCVFPPSNRIIWYVYIHTYTIYVVEFNNTPLLYSVSQWDLVSSLSVGWGQDSWRGIWGWEVYCESLRGSPPWWSTETFVCRFQKGCKNPYKFCVSYIISRLVHFYFIIMSHFSICF